MAKILLVEDNEMNRDMLSRRLHRKGYTIVFAVNGAEGVAMAQAEVPSLILMDLDLPILDGWEATRQIKQSPRTSQIPVIALTAHVMAGDREKALKAGCDDYDTKPVDLNRLLPKIEALLIANGHALPQESSGIKGDLPPKLSDPDSSSTLLVQPVSPKAISPSATPSTSVRSAVQSPSPKPVLSPSRKLANPAIQPQPIAKPPVQPASVPEFKAGIPPNLRQKPNQPPISVVNESNSMAPPTAAKGMTTPATVSSLLVVDDSPMNRNLLSQRLSKQGYQITVASRGQEALDLIKTQKFNLVLLDVMMPQMSGLEVLAEVRKVYSSSQLPIVMVTASDQSDDVVKALELGANDYITKPIDFPVAQARIKSLLTMVESFRQTQEVQRAITHDPSLLSGRYQLVKKLGSGGFGQTFTAKDTQRPGSPIVVVKQLKPQQTSAKALELARRLFKKEAETLERLKHEQIPQLFAYFEEKEEFYLVQEYIEGTVLEDELRRKPLSEVEVLRIVWSLLSVLSYIHRQNVIHRDIKPQNIIRRESTKKCVLIDFGSVKELSYELAEAPKNTIGIGSRGFTPQEQFAGRPRFNSDIYAVGMVAIQALTGLYPDQLQEDKNGMLLWQLPHVQVHKSVAEVINTMIRDDFRKRYQRAEEVISDLRRIISGSQTRS